MNEEQINNMNKALKVHRDKMKRLTDTGKMLELIVKSDKKILKFCDDHNLNFLWIKPKLKEMSSKFFILTQEQFLSLMGQPDFDDDFNRLFKALIQIKFIRLYKDDEYLVSELFNCYSELCDNYQMDSLEYLSEYYPIDKLDVHNVIAYYHSKHEDDPMWSSEGYCEYFNIEFCDEFQIGRADDE